MPRTEKQSPRFGVTLTSITGSSRPAHRAYGTPTGASSGRSRMPAWSSPSPISRSDSSMPALRTPRISPTFSVMPVPGMNVPGGANTPFMPVRAFGAPQTTRTVPSPVSTVQTRSRSAFGCGTASITRAMRNGARAAPRSSTPSSSRPMRVSVSVICSSVASVSRCVFSQERVNFIAHTPSCSMVGASGRKTVVAQPADVGVEERAQVGHAVLQHGDALDAHAPGEALPLARIDAAVGQHARMHHAGRRGSPASRRRGRVRRCGGSSRCPPPSKAR